MTIYNIELDDKSLQNNLSRIQAQIFKLLPMREEGQDWTKPLETLILELLGLQGLCQKSIDRLISLVCKLQGLLEQGEDNDFMFYRRSIFECCGIVDKIKKEL